MSARDERCETCRHFTYGVCFRYPPQGFGRWVEDRGWDYHEVRPSVSVDDWCGEWKARRQINEQEEHAMREEQSALERIEQETRAYEAGLDKNGNFHG